MKVAMELYKIANGPILIGSSKKVGRIAIESQKDAQDIDKTRS